MKTYVFTAVTIDQKQQEAITSEVRRIFGESVEPVFEVKSDLIGGVLVRYGDQEIDLTVKTELEAAKNYLSN